MYFSLYHIKLCVEIFHKIRDSVHKMWEAVFKSGIPGKHGIPLNAQPASNLLWPIHDYMDVIDAVLSFKATTSP